MKKLLAVAVVWVGLTGFSHLLKSLGMLNEDYAGMIIFIGFMLTMGIWQLESR